MFRTLTVLTILQDNVLVLITNANRAIAFPENDQIKTRYLTVEQMLVLLLIFINSLF
jgi:hypothetical protein